MGFHTVVATLVVVGILVFTAYSVMSGTVSMAEVSIKIYKENVKEAEKRLNTKIELISCTYNTSSGRLTFNMRNSGSEKFDSFTSFDVIVYGTDSRNQSMAIYLSEVNFSIVSEIINPGIFDPSEIAEGNAVLPVSLDAGGIYVLTLYTPNGVSVQSEIQII